MAGEVVALGSMDSLGSATKTLAAWIGRDVVIELRDGSTVHGALTGISGTSLLLKTQAGRWEGDMLDALKATLK